MRSDAGRFSAVLREYLACFALLCIAVLSSYLPAIVLRLSANPIYWVSGLISSYLPGRTAGYPWIDPNAGFTVQALGGYSAHQWFHGQIPWWNPYLGVGAPLAAEMQPASFFLPFVLLLHFANGVILLRTAMQMIAGLATFALLRQMGLANFAALLGGILYALNGTFAWFADSPILPVAFLPLLLLGVERAFIKAQEKQRGGWAWIAIALAYSIYAGFPETAYLDGLLVLAWTLYRFFVAPPDARWSFARKVSLAAVSGLLIATPLIVSFLEYQNFSAIRHSGWSHLGLPKISFAAFLMPYIFGPLHAFEPADASGLLTQHWANTGGYFSLTLLFLSLTALFGGTRLRGLRNLLAIWILIFAARTFNIPPFPDLLRLVPPLDYVVVFHYCEPSLELCGTVLAAFALDDWWRGVARKAALVACLTAFAMAALALSLSSGLVGELFHHAAHYSRWFWGSLCWAVVITWAVAVLLRRCSRNAAPLVFALIFANSFVLFAIPELAGMRNPKLDLGVVDFLRQHLGWERIYTFSPLAPNYGAYFRLASINHNAVPIPANWVEYIRQSLDPAIDPHIFIGYFPGPLTAREEVFRSHLTNFEATGVKYVLTSPGENPFTRNILVTQREGANIALPLKNGEQIAGILPPVPVKTISAIGVTIGTYGGAATGSLAAQVCAGGACSSGSAPLASAADNQSFYIPLTPELTVQSGEPLRYILTHLEDPASARQHEVAIWVWPARSRFAPLQVPGKKAMAYTPEITLSQPFSGAPARQVYHSSIADVFELPHPASYFEVQGGPCALSPHSRESLDASCRAPAVLIRRELYYPGWRAYVNGHRQTIGAASIFQSLHLPAGKTRVLFAYSPSHILPASLAMLAGLVILGFECIRRAKHLLAVYGRHMQLTDAAPTGVTPAS